MNRYGNILCAVGLVAFVFVANAQAGTFNVNPIRIQLSSDKGSELLLVRNTSQEDLRFQIEAFSWRQGPLGQTELSPTNDILFFPRMIRIAAGEERKIRIGLASVHPYQAPKEAQNKKMVGATEHREASYRIIVQELPSKKNASESAQIRVLTRMSIPIFVTPQGAKPKPVIEGLFVDGSKLTFQMKNDGQASTMITQLHVTAYDAEKRTLSSQKLPSWYLLAGDIRKHEYPIPAALCSKVHSFGIEATTTDGTLQRDYQPSQPISCVTAQPKDNTKVPAFRAVESMESKKKDHTKPIRSLKEGSPP